MIYDDYIYNASEVPQLEALLEWMPEKRFIERTSLEHRLSVAREQTTEGIPAPDAPQKVYVTFRGKHVREDSGIDVYFSAKTLRLISERWPWS